ncbi:Pol polyprotein [Trachymyrmex cornetzi]|uniref:Pol polyprotein n=1 Tax=Trachymyrmex cornetzi TaxID=471704 RepID=A0A151JC90_9HYME|nr:Pol polyprotein [Trachymyrmex cornetzi]
MPTSLGYKYCLTIIDRFSRWPEAIPLSDITAETVARELSTHWIARFGTPCASADHYRPRTTIESELFNKLAKVTGSAHLRTTTYHPAANGMIERFHRQLKTAIKSHQTEKWAEILPVVLMGIRAAWKEDLQATPAEMVYGKSIRLPGQFLDETNNETNNLDDFTKRLRSTMKELQPKLKRHGEKATFIYKDLATTQQVFLRYDDPKRSLQPPYDGPYQVLSRGEKTFKIRINGRSVNVSLDRLKPAYTLQQEELEKNKATQTPRATNGTKDEKRTYITSTSPL